MLKMSEDRVYYKVLLHWDIPNQSSLFLIVGSPVKAHLNSSLNQTPENDGLLVSELWCGSLQCESIEFKEKK